MWMQDVEEVVREIMRDERFKGHQNFAFEASLQDDGERVYGGHWGRGKRGSLLSDW